MTIRQLGLMGILILAALPAAAADGVAGKWAGKVDAPQGAIDLVFDLQVEGEKLTGAIEIGGGAAGMPAMPISDGTVKGNDVSFKLVMAGGPQGGAGMTIDYTGELNGDELALTSVMQGGPGGAGPAETQLNLTRVE